MTVGIALLNHEVAALNKADIGEPLPYTAQCLSIGTFRSDPEIANPYPLIRLGKHHAKRCGLRPCGRRTEDEGDELAPLHRCNHSITSSARASSDGGTVRPSALAVVTLTTKSNLVGCSTGRSLGFAPSCPHSRRRAGTGLGSLVHRTSDLQFRRV